MNTTKKVIPRKKKKNPEEEEETTLEKKKEDADQTTIEQTIKKTIKPIKKKKEDIDHPIIEKKTIKPIKKNTDIPPIEEKEEINAYDIFFSFVPPECPTTFQSHWSYLVNLHLKPHSHSTHRLPFLWKGKPCYWSPQPLQEPYSISGSQIYTMIPPVSHVDEHEEEIFELPSNWLELESYRNWFCKQFKSMKHISSDDFDSIQPWWETHALCKKNPEPVENEQEQFQRRNQLRKREEQLEEQKKEEEWAVIAPIEQKTVPIPETETVAERKIPPPAIKPIVPEPRRILVIKPKLPPLESNKVKKIPVKVKTL